MGIFSKSKNEGPFLKTIVRKNKIKSMQQFGVNDIRNLESLLDVSSVKLWFKSSKGESQMRTDYKATYKKVYKYLESLRKNCLEIKKCKPDELKVKVQRCMELKSKIEGIIKETAEKDENMAQIEAKRKEAKKPVNVKAIEKISRLTLEFNKYRAQKENKSIYEYLGIEPKIESYKDFESRMKLDRVTNEPLVVVKEFIEDKKALRNKEEDLINVYRSEFGTKFANGEEKKSFSKKLGDLAVSVGLNKSDLHDYFSSEDDFNKINKGLYGKLADSLIEKAKSIVAEYNDKNKKPDNEKITFVENNNLNGQIIEIMGGSRDVIDANITKELNKEKNKTGGGGYFKGMANVIGNVYKAAVNWFKGDTTALCDYFENCLVGNDQQAKKDINAEFKNLVEKFLKAWEEFIVAFKHVSEALEEIDRINEKVNELFGKFNEYIANISKASMGCSANNAVNAGAGENNKKASAIKIEKPEEFNGSVREFNNLTTEIGKTVSKVKRYYDAAVDNAECASGSLDNFVNEYINYFDKSLDKGTTFTLNEAILFAKGCIYNYKERHFGLDESLVNYFEENERMKLGITQQELRQIISNS